MVLGRTSLSRFIGLRGCRGSGGIRLMSKQMDHGGDEDALCYLPQIASEGRYCANRLLSSVIDTKH
jgi:hypothetical protein